MLEIHLFKLGYVGDVGLNKVARLFNVSPGIIRVVVCDPISNVGEPDIYGMAYSAERLFNLFWDKCPSATILTDDLHCHQPLCELLRKHKLHFILTCKPESHEALYEELGLPERVDGAISTKVV